MASCSDGGHEHSDTWSFARTGKHSDGQLVVHALVGRAAGGTHLTTRWLGYMASDPRAEARDDASHRGRSGCLLRQCCGLIQG